MNRSDISGFFRFPLIAGATTGAVETARVNREAVIGRRERWNSRDCNGARYRC